MPSLRLELIFVDSGQTSGSSHASSAAKPSSNTGMRSSTNATLVLADVVRQVTCVG